MSSTYAAPAESAMKEALQAYIDHFNAGDLDALISLFADDASVEDPVGSPAKRGLAEIRAFYDESIKTGAKLALSAPIRGSHADAAAMAFEARIGALTIRVIDVMTFDSSGKIASMKAYFGQGDFVQG
jgi:steroid delta-isomerase